MSSTFVALPQAFFERNTPEVGRDLLGKRLVRILDGGMTLVGVISEVEAYLSQQDLASHAVFGNTKRTSVLFGPAGHAYVHRIHKQHCLDVTTGSTGTPESVLIRNIIPEIGYEQMTLNRGRTVTFKRLLTNGPGKLTQAMQIDMSFYALDLTKSTSPLFFAYGPRIDIHISTSSRIGITKSKDLLLRFYLAEKSI